MRGSAPKSSRTTLRWCLRGRSETASRILQARGVPVAFKNKLENGVSFFSGARTLVYCPRLPRISPRFHHKRTTFCIPLFPKHPSKSPANPQKIPAHHRLNFSCAKPLFLLESFYDDGIRRTARGEYREQRRTGISLGADDRHVPGMSVGRGQ